MNNKQNNRMKRQLTTDLGPCLVTLDAEAAQTRDLVLITAFVNGISIRSSQLHLPAIRDRFLQGVWLMSGADKTAAPDNAMRGWIETEAKEGSP